MSRCTLRDPVNVLRISSLAFCTLAISIDSLPMRYLVLTDIHANLEALDACLADAKPRTYDHTLILGDLVGYGADPNAVIERVRSLQPFAMVRGNHDKVACGLEPADGFNSVAKNAVRWTLEALTPEHRTWLAQLPQGPNEVNDLVQICHGSPFDEDAYLFDELDAARALRASARPLCLFGHTHCPAAVRALERRSRQRGAVSRGAGASGRRLEAPGEPGRRGSAA